MKYYPGKRKITYFSSSLEIVKNLSLSKIVDECKIKNRENHTVKWREENCIRGFFIYSF
jgi:hypothetical protein